MTTAITASAACTVDSAGTVLWGKDVSTGYHTASTIKLLTCLVARDWLDMAGTATINATEAGTDGSYALLENDTLTHSDLIHATLLQSNNAAARCIGRVAGEAILASEEETGDPTTRMLAAMTARGTALGWTGHVILSVYGAGAAPSRLSAWQLVDLLRHIHDTDPWLYGVSGTLAHDLSVTGGRTATVPISHSINPDGTVKLPEFESGKTGTTDLAHVVLGWTTEGSRYYSSVVATTSTARYPELRAVMNDVILQTTRRRGGVI